MIVEHHNGIIMTPIIEGGDVVEPLSERVLGRVAVRRRNGCSGENDYSTCQVHCWMNTGLKFSKNKVSIKLWYVHHYL